MQYTINLPTGNNYYQTGNCIGGKITLSSSNVAIQSRLAVTEVIMIDKNANSNGNYDLIFFDSDLSGFANDNSSFAIANTDISKLQGSLPLSGSISLGANASMITLSSVYKRLSTANLMLYAVLVARANVNFSSTANSSVTLKITTERVPY